MKKIGFVTDTNILKKSYDELYSNSSTLDSTDIFIEYIDALNKTDSKCKLIYFMPELVIEELYSQKELAFSEQYEILESRFQKLNYALEGELPKNNIKGAIKSEKGKYLKKYRNIKLEYTSELFESLVNEAIKKVAPFDKSKEGKKADSGFKDALIWKTILLSNDVDECDIFYLISSDKIFIDNKDYLTKDFSKKHPKTELRILFFEPDGNQRQNALYRIIEDNGLIKTTVVKLYNKELLLDTVQLIKYNYSAEVSYLQDETLITLTDILFNNFTISDFIINDINENDNKYEVILSFETKKYVVDHELEEINKPILGKIKLYFKINDEGVDFETYKIENVKFYNNYMSQILSSIGSLYSDALKNSIEKLRKSLEINIEPIKKLNEFYQNENLYKSFDSIKEITKNINTSYQLEELKKSISLINNLNSTSSAFENLNKINYTEEKNKEKE